MDGYAVRGRQTDRASERTPIDLRLGEEAAYVDTGDALPGWADAVVPIENVEPVGGGNISDRQGEREEQGSGEKSGTQTANYARKQDCGGEE